MNHSSSVKHFIDTRDTRYHIVRVAAIELGWSCNDGGREDVPDTFHGMICRSSSSLNDDKNRVEDTAGEPKHCNEKEESDSTSKKHSLTKKKDGFLAPQIVWQDKSITRETLSRLAYYQRINHFLGMNCIARKALLFKRVMSILRKKVRPALSSILSTSNLLSESEITVYQRLGECLEYFYPESFSTINDYAALEKFYRRCAAPSLDEKADPSQTFFIIKPNTSCEGKGIRVTPNPLEALTDEERQRKVESVVQVYIDRPLLLEGKKFDLRIYVLLTSVCPPPKARSSVRTAALGMKDRSSLNSSSLTMETASQGVKRDDPLNGIHLFVHESGLVRVCALPYEYPSVENCNKNGIHLTNYAVNKRLDDFTVAELPQEDVAASLVNSDPLYTTGNKRDLQYMEEVINNIPLSELNEESMDHLISTYGGCSRWESVRRAIDQCITLTILSGVDVLRREYHGAVERSRQSRDGGAIACFELLGFDVMLHARTLQPVLMEVNHSPSLFCDTEFDFHLKQTVLKDCLQLLGERSPPLSECGQKSGYEKAMQRIISQHRSTRIRGDASRYENGPSNGEEHIVDEGAMDYSLAESTEGTGWRTLLPANKNGKWGEEQRRMQELMVKLSTSL